MIQVYKVREDGTFDYADSLVVEPTNIPEGYAEDTTTDYVKSDGTRPTEPELLEQSKSSKLAELNGHYVADLTGGFITTATGEEITFKYTEIDQLNFTKRTNAIALGTSDPSFYFGTVNGVKEFTTEQWKVVAKDAENHEMSVYAKLDQKRNQVQAATTISEVEAVVW